MVNTALVSAILIHVLAIPNIDQCLVTAYCPCEICCGEWAINREGPVIGASGRELISGYSVAADPNVYPLGTLLYIDGQEYRVDDVGGGVKGYHLDLYLENHEIAKEYATKDYPVMKECRFTEIAYRNSD